MASVTNTWKPSVASSEFDSAMKISDVSDDEEVGGRGLKSTARIQKRLMYGSHAAFGSNVKSDVPKKLASDAEEMNVPFFLKIWIPEFVAVMTFNGPTARAESGGFDPTVPARNDSPKKG